jgi:signal transduction histidine kinase/CheY-like chemotaxis protein/sensor domain CHASE-containing protein
MCSEEDALPGQISTSRFRLSPGWIGAVLAVGVGLSGALFFAIRNLERADLEQRAAGLAVESADQLQASIMRSMEVLYSIASFYAAKGEITRDDFRHFVQQALERQSELQALSWNPRVLEKDRAAVEAQAAAEGLANFQFKEKERGELRAAISRPEYIPVFYIEPLAGNATALGFDLASDARRRDCFEKARDTATPVATAPISLAQKARRQSGLLVLFPVYRGPTPATVAARREKLAGFAVAVFRASALVGAALDRLKAEGITAWLVDESGPGELIFPDGDAGLPPGWKTPATGMKLGVAGRRWTLAYAPGEVFYSRQTSNEAWLALGAGLVFTLLASAYLFGGWRRTNEIASANRALEAEARVRQEAEARADAANRAKSDFLASMSHEIRTPLNAILGYTQLMRRDPLLPVEQHDAIRGISASGQHLLGLINEILDLSKIEAGRMELSAANFDLTDLGRGLVATFQPLCAQKRIGFRFVSEAPGQCRVRGDESKLRQILINLVGNAVKFTDVGEVYVRFKSLPEGNFLFEVVDTGLGIPAGEQSEIFKPFHQGSGARHQGGTGLGLAIAQKQVALLGGVLELQSERGIGSRFYFTVPLPSAADARAESGEAFSVSRLKPGFVARVLVVDDHAENRAVLAGMLTSIGCEVRSVASGTEAVQIVLDRVPDIVFLDWLMPGLDGAATARALLRDPSLARPKIVAHTASPLARHRDEAFALGCVEFLAKPFRCERVFECLQRHLGVEFDYAEPSLEFEPPRPAGPLQVSLPDELYSRLAFAAELHSATAIKNCLPELRALGPDAQRLAERVRLLLREYDMDGISRLLSQAATPGAAGSNPRNADAFAST